MKVIVTGAAGFIGSHVVERFLSRGNTVIGIDNLSRPGSFLNLSYLSDLSRNNFRFHHADIRSFGDVKRVVSEHSDASLIVHEAGQVAVTLSVSDPRTDFEANALGTFNMLEAARSYLPGSIFLFASTNKVYGELEHITVREAQDRYVYDETVDGISESEPIDFHSPYGCSKGAAEQYVRDYNRIYGLRTVVFRQSCIYGTRQYGMEDQGWVAWFTIASLLDRPIIVYGDGKQVRDLLWIEDLIDLYETAVQHIDIAQGCIYNAGGGSLNTLSLIELLRMLEKHLGRKIDRTISQWRPGDQRIFTANCAKAARELGWKPRISPEHGVPALIDWTRGNLRNIESLLERKTVFV